MSKRVLIIDDETHIRRMIRITLETVGYKVGEAVDGPDGLEQFGDGSLWDCVLLDQRMPGMDGLETLRRIKARLSTARVIMATAYASIELAVDAMKLGATDFVRKPLTPETLRNAVAAVLSKPFASASAELLETTSEAIETVTMNGFSIVDEEFERPDQRLFLVMNPTGSRHQVIVKIDDEVREYVESRTHKSLSPESLFWAAKARRLLTDYLWTNGEVPRTNTLAFDSGDLASLAAAAAAWHDE